VSNAAQQLRVVVYSLGGTIASTHQGPTGAEGGVTPRLDVNDLVASVPGLAGPGELEPVSFLQVPSADLTLANVIALAADLERRFAEGARGAVVIQGTDTLEETAFALDLMARGPQPVVVTGAMRNPTLPGPDGPANLLAAVRVAMSDATRGLGTLVVFNDEIHAARFVHKSHTTSPSTFVSPSTGQLGWVSEGRVRVALRVGELARLSVPDWSSVPDVALLRAAIGDDLRIVSCVESLGYAGLVVEGFGGGHVPGAAASALGDLATRIPAVLASRTGSGEVLGSTYGFAGSERDLLSRGLISAGVLDGPKARVALSLALASGRGAEDVRRYFEALHASMGLSG
jgi:L-asparaginase